MPLAPLPVAEELDILVEQYASFEEPLRALLNGDPAQPFDLTGYNVIGEIRDDWNTPTAVTTFLVDVGDRPNGYFTPRLTPARTALLTKLPSQVSETSRLKPTYVYDYVAVRTLDGYRRRLRHGGVVVSPGSTRGGIAPDVLGG